MVTVIKRLNETDIKTKQHNTIYTYQTKINYDSTSKSNG